MLSVFCSCNSRPKEQGSTKSHQKIEKPDSDFEDYISTLDHMPLPLQMNPFTELPKISKNYDKSAFEKYRHSWSNQPLGIYYRDDKTIGIVDFGTGEVGFVPFLMTYDLNGNKVDSTGFYDISGQGLGYEAIEHLTFNTDRTIVVQDTVKRWDLDEEETEIVEGSMKMTSGSVEYRILGNGRIEKTGEKGQDQQ